MMKKLNLLYIVLCMSFVMNAQIQKENFNANTIPAGWTTTTPASGCTWEFGYTGTIKGSGFTTPASFPTGGVIFDDDACGADMNNHIELTSPEVDLVAAGVISAAIEITYNHQTFANDGDFFVDVWDGNAWQNVLTVTGDSPAPNTGTNATSTIDVTPYINSAFKVKFIYDDENSLTWGVGIDDYQLLDTATAGIEDLVGLGFKYYPNPVINDVITLHANEDISLVNVYNTIGQKVIAKKPAALEDTVNLQNLPSGVYIVQVAIGRKEGTFKIIKP